ncbi:ATP-grasp domain-containing protein [Streptomyces venezuelae]|uniref:ATP-grasp domain-containing protein n=1 Tax=Streptomyces venezuelae TaxID=54571 RepID=UPI00278BFB08|nr:ATP-grasp domain-containing protein [Streptomyces venezuelae]
MSERPVIVIGFVPAALESLAEFRPDGSVILIEEPDVIRKRDVRAATAAAPVVGELVEWEYQTAGAADEFFALHGDLEPAAVAAIQEYGTPFAARLAERYGLPGAGLGAVQLFRDKALLRKVTRAAGVANPASVEVEGPAEVHAFMAGHPGPVILKPANRQASVGTRVLHSAAEVDAAWEECVRQDEGVYVPDRPVPLRMLVEEYVSGSEYSVELLVDDGLPVFGNVTAKSLFPGPRPVEIGHVVPADVPDALAALLRERTERVLRAVGFGTGIVHCEWIVRDGTPYLVECAGRWAGDGIMDAIERAYRTAFVRGFWSLMLGESTVGPFPDRAEQTVAIRFLSVDAGVVESVHGAEEAAALPGVVLCRVTVAPGDETREVRSSWDRVGVAMAVAPTAAEAGRLAEEALGLVEVKVRPSR